MKKNDITAKIILEENGLAPKIILNISFIPSPEFLQGIQCNPADRELLFNILSDELEKLRLETWKNHE